MGSGRRQLLILLGALGLCPLAALLISADPTAPVARALALADLERALGIHVEPALQSWAQRHDTFLDWTRAFYLFAHVPVTGWVLVWTWYLRRDRFARVRDTFLWTQGLLVAVYVLWPVAPPHLVPGTPAAAAAPQQWDHGLTTSAHLLQDPFAAVPSGHIAFALIVGATFARIGDMRWLRAFGWVYPPAVALATIVTGHHLIVDLIAGGLIALAGFRMSRIRLPVMRAAPGVRTPSAP